MEASKPNEVDDLNRDASRDSDGEASLSARAAELDRVTPLSLVEASGAITEQHDLQSTFREIAHSTAMSYQQSGAIDVDIHRDAITIVRMRHDGRLAHQLRPLKITRQFTRAPGSVLWEQGGTVVLCTASVTRDLPPWFREDRPGGWVTAEYVMLPASTPQRKPWPRTGHTDSRGTEIQRLIGRCVRAVLDLSKIGPHTIAIDCQVLQADGGTRTASICGAYVALVDALATLPAEMPGARQHPQLSTGDSHVSAYPPIPARYDSAHYKPSAALVDQLAAVSVGVVDGELRVDLDYIDDSRANVDMNIAVTAGGKFVEVQGAAENGEGFDRDQMSRMLDMGVAGCQELMVLQRQALQQVR